MAQLRTPSSHKLPADGTDKPHGFQYVDSLQKDLVTRENLQASSKFGTYSAGFLLHDSRLTASIPWSNVQAAHLHPSIAMRSIAWTGDVRLGRFDMLLTTVQVDCFRAGAESPAASGNISGGLFPR